MKNKSLPVWSWAWGQWWLWVIAVVWAYSYVDFEYINILPIRVFAQFIGGLIVSTSLSWFIVSIGRLIYVKGFNSAIKR